MRAAESSIATLFTVGFLGITHQAEHRALSSPCLGAGLSYRLEERRAFHDKRQGQHGVVHPQFAALRLAAAEDRVQALIDGEGGTGDEDRTGRKQRPEVALLAVAERVYAIGRTLRAPQRKEKQEFRGAVARRVSRLGQQRSRAGDQAGDQLEDPHPEVRREGEQHRQRASTLMPLVTHGMTITQDRRRLPPEGHFSLAPGLKCFRIDDRRAVMRVALPPHPAP